MENSTAASLKYMLVALDGSRSAEAVLPIARTLATALGGHIILLHVLEHEAPKTIHGERHLATLAEADVYLAQVAARIRGAGLTVDTHVHPNPERDVAGSIATHAADLNTKLIAMAAHGRGRIRDLLVGRIPQQVAARAGRPVLIVPAPAGRSIGAVRRIMLPVDQAGEATTALPVGQLLAVACNAELFLVTVVPTPDTMPGDAGAATVFLPRAAAALLDMAEDDAHATLEQLAGKLTAEGITVNTEVRRGDPAREILGSIVLQKADLVVLATHARAGLDGLLSGSVGPRVVGSSPCPVLLIPIRSSDI